LIHMNNRSNTSKCRWFPKEYALTVNYSLGAPKSFRVSEDGRRVFFLRAISGTSRVLDVWMLDTQDAREVLLFSATKPTRMGRVGVSDPVAERLRKERLRETATGITSYSIDAKGSLVAFAIGGDLYVQSVDSSRSSSFMPLGDATDVHLSPNGQFISFVAGGELFVADVRGGNIKNPFRISPASTPAITWGLPDFIAAEEMDRYDGHWWSPNSKYCIFEGVDESDVNIWRIANPSDPSSEPRLIRYPQAGTSNAKLSLHIWSGQRGTQEIFWDRARFPYLVAVRWKSDDEPTIIAQSRSQRIIRVLRVNLHNGRTTPVYDKRDKLWVELILGVPTWSPDGQVIDAPDAELRVLRRGRTIRSTPKAQVRAFVGVLADGTMVYTASEDPRNTQVWVSRGDHSHQIVSPAIGVYSAAIGGNTIVVHGTTLGERPHYAMVHSVSQGKAITVPIKSLAATVRIHPSPHFFITKRRRICYSILFPQQYDGVSELPILMDPYGGPSSQRCQHSSPLFTASQWFADQGFAVIVADGRGTLGRGRSWEKSVAGDLIGPILEDQIAVLKDAVRRHGQLNSEKVAIRGWSFGGYLAAMAVIYSPHIFKTAIAGAPVTDWRYYDTHYSERYLGTPNAHADLYDRCSTIIGARKLKRPLFLIHGFEDDNVVCAHSLKLSQALFESGVPHRFLPLIGVTHMTASGTTAESLLNMQLAFLRETLDLD
jgi:dipeptidyl-peptidase-4